jgi:hypothetical protein
MVENDINSRPLASPGSIGNDPDSRGICFYICLDLLSPFISTSHFMKALKRIFSLQFQDLEDHPEIKLPLYGLQALQQLL